MKRWWESKTIWANLLAIVSGFLEALTDWIESIGAPNGSLVAIVGVLNVVLRFLTSQPIRGKS